MGVCWHCYWGWPKPIWDIYKKAMVRLGELDEDGFYAMHYGPAHIVWEDENFDSAQWCLDEFENWKRQWNDGRYLDAELEVVRKSLIELVAVPDEFKHEPEAYDDENPENYPPPEHWIMMNWENT